MNKVLLFLVMLPSALWKSLGADTYQLRAILGVKLTLDDRNPISLGRPQRQKKSRKYGSIINTVVFLAMGLVYMLPLAVIHDRIFSLTIFFSLLFAVITFMLITDFSSVLFDSRDKFILFPRPIADRTLVLARLLHVFIYLFRIVVPMALPGWVALARHDGWASATLFVLPLILLIFMALFIVNSFYLLVLRLVDPARFKDVMNYFQVLTSVIFFASVYLLPQMFKHPDPANFNILGYPWVRYVPTYWLAACWSWIGYPVTLAGTASYSILAVVFPVVCMYFVVTKLSPQFSRRIAGIDASEGPAPTPAGKKISRKSGFGLFLTNALNRSNEAKAGFMIAWLQTSRSRTFRMRVYPSLAFVPIYFIYIIMRSGASFHETYQELPNKPTYLLLIYMSSFAMITALGYLTMSDQYKASWIYYSTPVKTPGNIMIGALKALLIKFFLPFFFLLSCFILYVWGASALWDILLGLVNIILFVSCVARISFRQLPFSVAEQIKQSGGRVMKAMVSMIVPLVLGGGHYFAWHLLWLKLVFLVLSVILLWLVWTSYAETTWDNMLKIADE